MTHSWFVLAILALATHRATVLVVTDEITKPLREWFRTHGYATSASSLKVTNRFYAMLFRLTQCVWCSSIYIGAIFVLLAHYQFSWFQYVAYALGLSSVASVAHDAHQRMIRGR